MVLVKLYSILFCWNLQVSIVNRYIMIGRGICDKYQLRAKTFPELVEHWLN